MRIIVLGILLILQKYIAAFDDSFYAPVLPKTKISLPDLDEPAPILLGKDEESGCICRESPKKWVVCFGRDTCKRFPKNLKVEIVDLRIKGTLIEELRLGDLSNWTQLTSMRIEGDDSLIKIEAGVFANMTNLTNLSISYCTNLRQLEEDTFYGLVNLRELYLIQNGFTSVSDATIAFKTHVLLSIVKIVLSENCFTEIERDDFKHMEGSSLRELNLILCRIEYIHPQSLMPLENLHALRLGENIFNVSTITDLIKTTVEAEIPLRLLNLYSVGFRSSPPETLLKTIAASNITNLCLARNQFEIIKDSSFPVMPNLEILDLREVLVLNVTENAFAGMPNLRTLLLSGNKLTTIPEGVLLPQLTYLDLCSNSGNLFYPSYFSLGKDKLRKMRNLQLLNLSYNRVTGLFNYTFTGLESLFVLGLKNATVFYVADYSFFPLKNLVLLNLENNPLAKNHPLTQNMFAGLDNLQVLLLGGCSISYIDRESPFEHLTSLKHLGLERNNLRVLYSTVFSPLRNLETLDISGNVLKTWHQSIFNENEKLTKVKAMYNKFTYLSEAMLIDFENLEALDLSENPFSCDCNTFNVFAKWSSNCTNSSLLQLLQENSAACVYPDSSKNLTLSEYLQDVEENEAICKNENSNSLHLLLIIILPSVAITVILVVSAIVIYVYRWHVSYWIFLTRIALSRKGIIKNSAYKEPPANYLYDAFVSYSNEDRNFVLRLVAMLENYEPFLKLCVYERDFQVGSLISESIMDSVLKSRRTILIISDSYARSQWCRWETHIAEHHRLYFKNDYGDYVDDSLILIKLGPVNESHITPTLKFLLKTRIYLEWDSNPRKQRIFWQKLRNTLAPPKSVVIRNALVDSSNV